LLAGGLVLTKHGSTVIIGERIAAGIQINQQVVIGNNLHGGAEVGFVHPVDAVHSRISMAARTAGLLPPWKEAYSPVHESARR
jgi:serine acetyltransferase